MQNVYQNYCYQAQYYFLTALGEKETALAAKNYSENLTKGNALGKDDLQKFFDDQRIDLRVKTRKSNANGKINSSGDLKYLYGPWSKRFISKKYKKIIKDFDYDI